uniref:Uncharacterized protein n=1 Tax=Parascaris univalens TaxID=6257 RepID=A0A915AU74_PARUN
MFFISEREDFVTIKNPSNTLSKSVNLTIFCTLQRISQPIAYVLEFTVVCPWPSAPFICKMRYHGAYKIGFSGTAQAFTIFHRELTTKRSSQMTS